MKNLQVSLVCICTSYLADLMKTLNSIETIVVHTHMGKDFGKIKG